MPFRRWAFGKGDLKAGPELFLGGVPESSTDALRFGEEVSFIGLGSPMVVDELYRGGMGVVAKLVSRQGGRAMALKTYQRVDDSDRFQKEARAWASLSGHPNIARLSWFGQWRGAWSTLGLWYPRSLKDVAFSDDPVVGQAMLVGIVEALVYAVEDNKILHRDLKPANILIDENGQSRIADFGLAASLSSSAFILTIDQLSNSMRSLTTVGDVAGTPAYMAPELFTGTPPSISSELYSFGVTAYEFLTAGEHPYCGVETGFRFQPLLRREPLARFANASSAIQQILPALLELDPDDRPASFTDVLQALGGGRRRWQRSSLDLAKEVGVQAAQGRLAGARELAEQSLNERPDDPALLLALSVVLGKEGFSDQAFAALERACSAAVNLEGRLEGEVYVDPLVILARSLISRGALARAASILQQARQWTSPSDRRFFPPFGWLDLYEGEAELAVSTLLTTHTGLDDSGLTWLVVAASRSERRTALSKEILTRLGADETMNRRRAAIAALAAHWLPATEEPAVTRSVQSPLAKGLAQDLGLPNDQLIPLDSVRASALLGALETETLEEGHPSDHLVDDRFMEETFARTAQLFMELFPEHAALNGLEEAVGGLLSVLGYPPTPADPSSQCLWSLATAGYVWRRAEQLTNGARNPVAADVLRDSFDPTVRRAITLGFAALKCLERQVPLWLSSPGGLEHGMYFLQAAFSNHVEAFARPGATIGRQDLFYAYSFGLALRDCESAGDELSIADAP